MSRTDPERTAAIQALRELLFLLEQHPDLPVPTNIEATAYPDTAAELFDAADLLGIEVKRTDAGHLHADYTISEHRPRADYRLWLTATAALSAGIVTRKQVLGDDGGSVAA